MISIVVPTYQRAHLIERTLRSVLSQEGPELELIVVDDGSLDGTRDIVSRIGDSRLRYVWQENAGRCAARNRGAQMARGEFVVFLDSDDEALPGWAWALAEAASPCVALTSCAYEICMWDGAGRERTVSKSPRRVGPSGANLVVSRQAGTFAVRRGVFEEVGGYDTALCYAENSELFLRLIPFMASRGLSGVKTAEEKPLLRIHRRREALDRRAQVAMLTSIERILQLHETRFLASARSSYVNYHSIAAVASFRLGHRWVSRQHLLRALVAQPWRLGSWGRLGLALFPGAGQRVWGSLGGEFHPELE